MVILRTPDFCICPAHFRDMWNIISCGESTGGNHHEGFAARARTEHVGGWRYRFVDMVERILRILL